MMFDNVTFRVKEKGSYKKIIDGVSGKFHCGHLTAIMGPSGAGKTSLLNILTGYQVTGTTGTIKCNSSSRKQKGVLQYKKESCYILQDDSLPNLFTVEECMMIASKLKIANMAKKAREFLINEILTNLSLLKAKNTRCQSLSGGQKKRLSIALELVDNPPILFLDEPTTGLDSASTTQCVDLLKKLANGGRIVICTIHQPNTQTYEMFDQVYMLAKGRCVYQGPSTNTVPFLASVGLHCPQYHNPADYIMEVVSGEYGDHIDQLAVAAQDKKWQNIPTIKLSDTPAIDSKDNNIIYSDENVTLSKSPSEWKRFFILLQRSSVQLYRDWTISQLKLVLHLLVGLFLGITFQNCGRDATKVISNLGFLQVGIVYLAYTSMMPAVLKFPTELVILKKESFNNWYKLTTYYAAFLVFDIPQQMLFSTVYCIGCYFVSDQPLEVDRFFSVLFVLVLASLSSSGFGLILGTITNPINGVFFGAVGLCFFISVGGFFIMFTHMSNVMYLFSYISYISFSVEGVMQAIYGYGRGQLHCPEEAEFCQYVSSEVLLEDIGMSKPNYWIDIIYLTCTFLTFRTIAFVTLKRKLANP
ncbi:ATP-binding cassette sub-family G member 1 isoform X3 [Diabrotica virgifera virgifera]|uniref:ATP-binding cassette sub-family G member 1 isoform X3 n=1 Tax=Diabrotica virgifera virgifera TaxID=50390 RepID=A0A6P7FV42_DIAVI|nr:ATP-binding cassette sub-family G member 1 isoform X3 [Diabrotica virgifera virgifera]KAI2474076.1 ATP binding cassette (ABC) transporter subfamily G member [Diabrotica virgifera virgifera]